MELRHLRYYLAVCETLNLTKAAARLRVAQPALSRQIHDLEDEIGIELLIRSTRGVRLTPEGRVFLEEAREVVKRADESVTKTRAFARGEFGELQVGYSPSPTVEILPKALSAFQKSKPGVKVILHDLAGDELIGGLREGSLHMAVMAERIGAASLGLRFEELCRYRLVVAVASDHPLARRRTVSIAKVAAEPLVAFRRRDYSGYYKTLEEIFSPHKVRPRVAVECDSASSLITEVEVGKGVAVVSEIFRLLGGRRLVYRPFSDSSVSHGVGIMRAADGNLPPAGERFSEALRVAAKLIRIGVPSTVVGPRKGTEFTRMSGKGPRESFPV